MNEDCNKCKSKGSCRFSDCASHDDIKIKYKKLMEAGQMYDEETHQHELPFAQTNDSNRRVSDTLLWDLIQKQERTHGNIYSRMDEMNAKLTKIDTDMDNVKNEIGRHRDTCPAYGFRDETVREYDILRKELNKTSEVAQKTDSSLSTLQKYILPIISMGHLFITVVILLILGLFQWSSNSSTNLKIEMLATKMEATISEIAKHDADDEQYYKIVDSHTSQIEGIRQTDARILDMVEDIKDMLEEHEKTERALVDRINRK